ncbi:MAG: dihydroorotate dehydrogenase electron transfer subunit [Bifidobacterium crudilactis]|jgi:dihydroorotate dehydrogenase electron transfer subunit|nr:dihydroorotate dehydrogenase electron transfer subunit [Bifidobacterium crudilactis]MCI1890405.1 dihydroorotate dehydrogenase electron transfer subunit [Bifidobacterium crudilactis]
MTKVDEPDGSLHTAFLKPRHSAAILRVEHLTPTITRLVIQDSYVATYAAAGQFVNLYTQDSARMMPRPFGVAGIEDDTFSVIFAIVGSGTRDFSLLEAGDRIDVLGPLGHGFDMSGERTFLLVGGGLGIPPLLYAAQQIHDSPSAQAAVALFGYRDTRFADALAAELCDKVLSIDEREGNVITLLDRVIDSDPQNVENFSILSCGPHPMMKAVAQWASTRGIPAQLSLEARMGCGFGTCVVCVQDTVDGRKKVCLDGPVFTAENLGWAV